MKLKINKKHQKEIAKIRMLIEKHRLKEDLAIEKLAKSMKIDPSQEISSYFETLWDHIYNQTSWTVELE